MNWGFWIAMIEMAAGVLLTAVSVWSFVRSLQAVVVRGRVNDFRRSTSPVSFWLTIVATGLAAALGIALLIIGSAIFR